MAKKNTIPAKDFRAGDRWPGGFVSKIIEANIVDWETIWIHDWQPSVGGLSRTMLPPMMPFEQVSQ